MNSPSSNHRLPLMADASSPFTNDDIIINDNSKRLPFIRRVQSLLLIWISGFCTFLFIGFIFVFALVRFGYHRWVLRDHSYAKVTHNGYEILHPESSADLDYYAQLIGLKIDVHQVTTEDGFVLTLQHLYNPTIDQRGRSKLKPILLIHGLMQSSGSFLTSGYKSLAFHLVSNGHDVWMGNNRCGFNPKHLIFDSNDERMWNWDLNEMAKFDIPAMVEKVIALTRYKYKISIMAHSQGTTQCVYLFSKQFGVNFNDKVDKCVLLAPAVYGGPLLNSQLFIKFMRGLPDWSFTIFFGKNSFMPILMHLRRFTYKLNSFGFSSYVVFSYLFAWNDYLWDKSLRRIHFIFSPVYVSVKLMNWWLRSKNGQGFEEGKPIIKDPNSWFTKDTPDFFLLVGGKDDLVNGELFINRLKNLEPHMHSRWQYLKIDNYSHLDVLWADDLLDKVGGTLLNFLQK